MIWIITSLWRLETWSLLSVFGAVSKKNPNVTKLLIMKEHVTQCSDVTHWCVFNSFWFWFLVCSAGMSHQLVSPGGGVKWCCLSAESREWAVAIWEGVLWWMRRSSRTLSVSLWQWAEEAEIKTQREREEEKKRENILMGGSHKERSKKEWNKAASVKFVGDSVVSH